MSSAPPPDAAARRIAESDPGSVLLQAPAGSGKTTLLVQRYLRLLSSVDAPERILALTFTRRAAGEMRERVVAALEAAQSGERPEKMNEHTFELAARAAAHLASLGIDVQSSPARMRIETIDAFNAWLAAQMPLAAGTAGGMQVQPSPKRSYREAARRALAYEEPDQFGAAVERLLKLDDQRWRGLVELIADMLPGRDRWLPLLAGRMQATAALDEQQQAALRRHFDEDLEMLVRRVLERACACIGAELLEHARLVLDQAARTDSGAESPLGAWTGTGRLGTQAQDVAAWRVFANVALTRGNTVRQKLTKDEGFPPASPAKAPMLGVLEQLQRIDGAGELLTEVRRLPQPRYDDAQWSRARDVALVLVLAAAELDAVFREQGCIDFTAVSLAALRALNQADAPTDLALRLDYKLRHILVDEFQDTSSAQLELVRQLTRGWQPGDGRSIFCVGDPMQSIYGFRQAEVRAFLELAEQGLGEARFRVERLTCNFRSAAQVVEWNNDCFQRILPRQDDRERGAIAFRPSTASPSIPVAGEVACAGFADYEQEARGVAAAVAAELLQSPQARIAVLVRARTHAREIAEALRERSIRFRAVDIEPLQDTPMVRDILMLARALLHFGDRIAWLALLRAPWAGLSLADLLLVSEARFLWDGLNDDALLARLSEQGRMRCLKIVATLKRSFAVRNSMSFTRWVESTWLALGGPATALSAADVKLAEAAFRRLKQLEDQGLPDPAELESSFEDLFADPGSEAQVEIMTIHRAKGLEFDMVVVPALDRAPGNSPAPLLIAHGFARTVRDGLVLAARTPVGQDEDALFAFLSRQQRQAAALEAQRLLYVACTRPKRRLLLTASLQQSHEGEGEEGARAFRPMAGSLLSVLWPGLRDSFAVAQAAPTTAGESQGAPRALPLSRLPAAWVVPRVAESAASAPVSAPAAEPWPEFDWAGETARRVGSLVHRELQSLTLDAVSQSAISARKGHFRRWLAAHGVPPERLEQAAQRVVEALSAVHSDPRGRWIFDAAHQESYREHSLSAEHAGEIIRVVFDRTFVDAKGVRWVIDYKTSHHAGGGREEFLDREVERYRPQLERYALLARRMGAQPVKVGLYFPLMRGWREWMP